MSRAFRVGVFVVATLLVLAAGIFLIGRKQHLFSSTYHLKAQFDNVAGLGTGAEVRVGGINKGTVNRIDLPRRADQRVTVLMDIEKGTRGVIKKDSTASIKTEGLLGNKYVEVSFGSEGAATVNDWDTISSEAPLDIADLMKKTDKILDNTKEAMLNITDTTGNLKSVTAKIDQGKGTVGALVNDKKMYQEASAATAEAKAGATAFQENMEALKHNFLLRGYFRKRGYEDSSELAKHEIPRLPREPSLKRFAYDGKQIFDKADTTKLKNEKQLNEAGAFLEKNKFGVVVVAASSGLKGDADKHRVLTQARAMVVRDYLAEHFRLDDTRIKTMGLGETRDAGDSGTVEIMIYPAASP